jgi:flagellar hook-length control protein FliK
MNETMILPIASSPPPAQTVKATPSASAGDASFEDVLKAQTMTQNTSSATPANGSSQSNQPSNTPSTEAAKSNSSTDQVPDQGDKKQPSKNQTEPTNPTDPVVQAQAMAVYAVAVVQVPVQPIEPTPTVDPSAAQVTETTAAVQPVDPGSVQTSPTQSTQPVVPIQQPVVEPTAPAATPSESAATAPQPINQPVESQPATASTAATTDPQTTNVQAAAIPAQTNGQDESKAQVEKPVSQTSSQPVQAAGPTENKKVDSASQVKETAKDNVPSQAAKPEEQVVTVNKQQGKSNQKDDELTEGQPKQVQAPPGTSVTEVTTGITKPANISGTQSIEPARLAEAHTIDLIGQISRQMENMTQSGKNTYRLQLYPQDLGQIDMKITSTSHGVGVSLVAENAATSKLLEGQLNQLRQNLTDAGVQVTNLHIGTQAGQQQSSGSQLPYQKQFSHVYTNDSISTDPEIVYGAAGESSLVDYKI